MKKSILLALSGLVTFCSWGIPARPHFQVITNADGTTLTIQKIGDERWHGYITTDSLPVDLNAKGQWCYRTLEGLSDVAAHDVSHRQNAEREFIAQRKGTDLSVSAIARKALASSSERMLRASNVELPAGPTPCTGENRIPILLVQFPDIKFTDPAGPDDIYDYYDHLFNDPTGSVASYFRQMSGDKYQPQFDIYGPYTAKNQSANYGANKYDPSTGYYTGDTGVGALVAEACNGLDFNINFRNFDNNSDGVCDVVIVMYAGFGEANVCANKNTSPWMDNLIWPQQSSLTNSDYKRAITLDKTKINRFCVFNEMQPSGFDKSGFPLKDGNGNVIARREGIGTPVHEFSHCLGLPDFYDVNYGNCMGMDVWSVMDHGGYNNDGYTPLGYNAYEKAALGWLQLTEAEPNTQYTLAPMNNPAANAPAEMALTVTNDNDPNEYYVLEARKQQGWDQYIPSTGGLLVTHVTYSPTYWSKNFVNSLIGEGNTNTLERCVVIPADNIRSQEDREDDLWPFVSGTKTTNALTDTSSPAATVNTPRNGKMGKPITEITRNASDGSVSLWFMRRAGIDDVTADCTETTEGPSTYFNLQGQRVAHPAQGQLLLRRSPGGKVEKVVFAQ